MGTCICNNFNISNNNVLENTECDNNKINNKENMNDNDTNNDDQNYQKYFVTQLPDNPFYYCNSLPNNTNDESYPL